MSLNKKTNGSHKVMTVLMKDELEKEKLMEGYFINDPHYSEWYELNSNLRDRDLSQIKRDFSKALKQKNYYQK